MHRAPDFGKALGWFRCAHCGQSTWRATSGVEILTDPPKVEMRYRRDACSRESLRQSGPNPAALFLSVFIPLIAFTFSGVAYLLPAALGLVGWLAASAVAIVVAYAGMLLIQRITYTFAPTRANDA
jgi:hypothetical protein